MVDKVHRDSNPDQEARLLASVTEKKQGDDPRSENHPGSAVENRFTGGTGSRVLT